MKKGIISILSAATGAAIAAGAVCKVVDGKTEKVKAMSDKHLALLQMMNQWVKVKQESKSLAVYLEQNGCKKIAIYGMSYAGKTLLNELRDTGIEVVYAIDKNADSIYAEVNVVSVKDDLAPVDAVVVTAITFFDEIVKNLSQKLECPIFSLEDILYEV